METFDDIFHRLQNVAALMALIGTTEDLHLDCKIWPAREEDGQRLLAKALSGFTNAEGGVIVIGMEARSAPSKEDPDLIQKASPVSDVIAVKSRIENLIGQLVDPRPEGVKVTAILDSPESKAGFLTIKVPPSEGLPCRSRKDWKFYQRISAGTYPMEYFQIADMFGKRRRPVLKLYLEEGQVESRGVQTRLVVFGIENCGRAIARFPTIRLKPGRFQIDPYGIDGNYGFGLPRLPSQPDWIVFGGGSDHVIHPGTVLKIAKLLQQSDRSEWQRVGAGNTHEFRQLTVEAELAADEFPITSDSKSIAQSDQF
jgi:hypothetical protein